MRGYSNGNTYVYDPYEKANIGWYPVVNLWNEQSHDAIDTAEVGVPFFKITTQKMAQLERAKAVANEGLDEAKQAVKQAEANVTALEQVISQTSQAKDQLAAAKANLVTAKDMLDKAKQRAKLVEQDLETKTVNLKQAQEHLTLKQDDLAKAQTVLAAQETSLEQLTQALSVAQANLERATEAVEQAKADLTQNQTYVTNLKQVTKLRQDSQDKVNQAKAVLGEASARLEQELETLKTLQAKETNLTAQYQAVLAAKHHSQLAESKAKLEAKGEEAVPVVNEVGHVTDYVSGSTQLADAVAVRTEETSSKTKNTSLVSVKAMDKQGHQKALETIVTSQSSLPQTGEQVVSILSLVGLNFLGLSSFLGLRKQEEK
ncbi:LPXTG cell wall anchor domain-containing protein [Streptococcus iniae]